MSDQGTQGPERNVVPEGALATGPAASRVSAPRLFLERRSYTERRRIDALRFLPFVAGCLWLVPLVWRSDTRPAGTAQPAGVADAATLTSSASLYLFVVWALLIIAGFYLARRVPMAQDAMRAGYFDAPGAGPSGPSGTGEGPERATREPAKPEGAKPEPTKAPQKGPQQWDS